MNRKIPGDYGTATARGGALLCVCVCFVVLCQIVALLDGSVNVSIRVGWYLGNHGRDRETSQNISTLIREPPSTGWSVCQIPYANREDSAHGIGFSAWESAHGMICSSSMRRALLLRSHCEDPRDDAATWLSVLEPVWMPAKSRDLTGNNV